MRSVTPLLLCLALGSYGCAQTHEAPPPAPSAVVVSEASPPPTGFTEEVLFFKGIPLGKPGTLPAVVEMCEQETAKKGEALREFCKVSTDGREPYIGFPVSYGPTNMFFDPFASFYFAADDSGTVEKIQLLGAPNYMEELAVALTSKYGPSLAESALLQNGFGAVKVSDIRAWQDPEGNQLALVTMDPNISDPRREWGRTIFTSAARLARDAQDEQDRKRSARENL